MSYRSIGEAIAEEEIAAGKPVLLRVSGTSMAPILREGDRVSAAPVSRLQLRAGDLVVIRRGESFVTHRLIRLGENSIQTKGDNLRYPDPESPLDNLVGRVISIRSGARESSAEGPIFGWTGRLIGWLSLRTATWYQNGSRVAWLFHGAGLPFRIACRLAISRR